MAKKATPKKATKPAPKKAGCTCDKHKGKKAGY